MSNTVKCAYVYPDFTFRLKEVQADDLCGVVQFTVAGVNDRQSFLEESVFLELHGKTAKDVQKFKDFVCAKSGAVDKFYFMHNAFLGQLSNAAQEARD